MRLLLSGLCAATLLSVAGPAMAQAQSDACADGGKLMQQRQGIVQSLQAGKGRKMTPVAACQRFNGLVANGQKVIEWLEKSGAWCGAPDGLLATVKDDHQKAIGIRGQACGAAAKYNQMVARARAQARAAQQQQGPGRLGGGGGDIVSGQMRVPGGAL